MTLKELKEVFSKKTPVSYCGQKCVILEITENLTFPFLVVVSLLQISGNKSAFMLTFNHNVELNILTPWEEPINKGENMKTQEQKTLELIKAALAGEDILWMEHSLTINKDLELIRAILELPNYYSIKPKTKAVNYQTRAYETTEGNFRIWNSLYGYTQKSIENFLEFERWLEPTQEHICEYEVTE